MSRFLVRLAISAAMSVFFAGAMPAAEQDVSPRPLPSAGQAKILAALDQPTEFDFQNRPLGEVVNIFKETYEIEILLDRKALSDARIDRDAPITQALNNITLRSGLRLMLAQLDLTYLVRDGCLLITSKVEAESKLTLKVYPVQDLVTLDSDFRPAPLTKNGADNSPSPSDMLPHPTFPGMGGMGMGRIDDEGDFSELIEMITATVAPTTWDEVGGPGSITGNPHTQAIAISQTDDVHDEIVVLLAALRRVRDEQIAAAKPPKRTAPTQAIEQNKPIKVRAFRLMGRTQGMGKSGWRPPTPIVGDLAPPRGARTGYTNQQAPEPPVAQANPAKDTSPAEEVESGKETKGAEPAKEPEPAGGAAGNGGPTHPADNKLESMVEKLAKLVPEIIEPQSWEPTGEGMIRAVGEGIVVRNTEEVQHRVARLMAELLPDCVPMDFGGPWGPWKAALEADHAAVRLKPGTIDNWPQQSEPRPRGPEARIYDALQDKCDLEFDQLPLIDALNRLAEPRHVQLYIDYKALTEASVDKDTLVTCSVKGLSYKSALEVLLDELDLTYLIRDDVLLITTKTAAESMLAIRVYPVFDLVVRPPAASASRPGLDFQSFIDNIVANVAPKTWDEVGGPASIEPFTNSGALVISQTTAVHEEIAEYLRAHREVVAAQNAGREK